MFTNRSLHKFKHLHQQLLNTTTNTLKGLNGNSKRNYFLLNKTNKAINKTISLSNKNERNIIVSSFSHSNTIRMLSFKNKSNNDDEINDNSNRSKLMKLLSTVALPVTILFGKTKYLFIALKLTKAMPLLSMILTSFAYSLFYGWPYAIGMVGLMFMHECGHAIVIHHYKLPFSPMVFIPFLGAVISLKEEPVSSYDNAMIAFGGPVLGSLTALGVGMTGITMESQLLIALADFGYMINLFNLLPIGTLDGGRIGDTISPYFGLVGLSAGGCMIYLDAISNPIFYLVMLSGVYSTGMRFFGDNDKEKEEYYNIPKSKQMLVLTSYLALIASLIMAMNENNKYRMTPKQLEALKKIKDNINDEDSDNVWNIGLLKPNSTNPNLDQHKDGVYDDYFSDYFKEIDNIADQNNKKK